ncbi:DUF4145 domain-containing protein [Acinetobacter terrae]|jgi:hypothetical protein|uniref:DUF4145 domain-containing protein n=1 Tax=Acinetobacter terrae TaxID=2731247 RepID=A0A4R0EN98_9GAMM|nr:DUF4145 domain-containing protein [Acinetobacter terrae]TCB60256.1 DUF4145 domain-containing protein [Acinetobacter terrae]
MKLPELPKTILDQKSFKCPHCGAFAHMEWDNLCLMRRDDQDNEFNVQTRIHQATCVSCNKENIWYNHRTVSGWIGLNGIPRPIDDSELSRLFPVQEITNQDIPNYLPDMPKDVKTLYKEAALIFELSPRSAAALIRLALEKLCEHLGVKKKNIKESIEELAKQQIIPLRVAQAADNIRLIGNANVHAGIICDEVLDDINPAIFSYINLIVDYAIKKPKEIEEINLLFPEQKRASF